MQVSFGLIFWILMLLWLLYGFWGWWGAPQPYYWYGHGALLFVLFLLLGWRIFGAPVHP
jgi:hypothetical protein